jgi:hypothetical protein
MIARVEPAAAFGNGLGGLDRLGIDDRGRRLGLAAGCDAALAAQLAVHRLGRTRFLPAVQHFVDGLPGRQVSRHRPPLDSFFDQIADGAG